MSIEPAPRPVLTNPGMRLALPDATVELAPVAVFARNLPVMVSRSDVLSSALPHASGGCGITVPAASLNKPPTIVEVEMLRVAYEQNHDRTRRYGVGVGR